MSKKKLKMEIDKLDGSYYSTCVSFILNGKEVQASFAGEGFEPSSRQLKFWKIKRKDLTNDHTWDGHYERKNTYDLINLLKLLLKDYTQKER